MTYIRVCKHCDVLHLGTFRSILGNLSLLARLVNGAVIPTSDPCTTHVVSKQLVIVSSSESENREPGQLRNAAVETHDFEVNRQFASRLLASSSANGFGKFDGRIPSVIPSQ